ncbi:MAG TPA: proline dehydrogenase family protein [Gemmatimonadota bacterium]|nr:proline dehydrogenase family protein [Gemmatimonadota bacterium]
MSLGRRLLLRASQSDRLREAFPRLPFAHRAVRRFMPGERAEDALDAARDLERHGLATVLTQLGENVTEPAEADLVADHYLGVLDEIGRRGLDAEISVKPTHLGLDLDPDRTLGNLERLAARSLALDRWLWIDMESSPYVDPTLDLYRELRARHPKVGVCLQAYLYRTGEDLSTLLPLDPGIRLVKGAYSEPEGVAYPRKRDVDERYIQLAESLLNAQRTGSVRAAFATHDRTLIGRIRRRAEEKGMEARELEFQMLYGIRPNQQRRLAAAGCRTRILISYGEAWFPWYMRRLAERPANVWFVARSALPW